MTVVAAWLTNRGDVAGGQTRATTRLTPIGTWWSTGELTSRSGLVPGGSPCLVTGTGMTASVAVGRAIIQGSTAAGAYAVAVTASEPVTIPNGDPANPRRDLIGIRVYNNLVDASGQTIAKIERLPGTPAPSPVDPTPPVGAVWLPLARVAVAANASAGSPINWGTAVTDLRVYTTSHGGILPVDASNSAGSYVGQYRESGSGLERWSGSAWAAYPTPAVPNPVVRVSRTTTLNLAANTYVPVPWQAGDGSGAMWSSGASTRLIASRAGQFRLNAWAIWPGGATEARVAAGLNTSSTQHYQLSFEKLSGGGQGGAGSVVLRMAATDYLTVQMYSNTATSLTTDALGAALEWIGA
jgi:hypothetical protein